MLLEGYLQIFMVYLIGISKIFYLDINNALRYLQSNFAGAYTESFYEQLGLKYFSVTRY